MNIKRILTSLIGFPIVMCVLILGNKYIIDIIMAIIAVIAMKEYINCSSSKVKVISWISYLAAASIGLLHIIPSSIIKTYLFMGIPSLLIILFLHVIISNMKINFNDITYTLMGILYVFGFVMFLPLIYGVSTNIDGKILIWYVMFSAWGTDVFAYLVGHKCGKIKFSKVSPNKTVEGCIAGVIGSVIVNLIFTFGVNYFGNLEISYAMIAIVCAILSIIGQIGDFAASVIKRYFEVKDFSDLFPGHGGMLDRIDSVMFIAPFAYLLLTTLL